MSTQIQKQIRKPKLVPVPDPDSPTVNTEITKKWFT